MIQELVKRRLITASVYYTFIDLEEAISSKKEFSSLAENELFMFYKASFHNLHYSVRRLLFYY